MSIWQTRTVSYCPKNSKSTWYVQMVVRLPFSRREPSVAFRTASRWVSLHTTFTYGELSPTFPWNFMYNADLFLDQRGGTLWQIEIIVHSQIPRDGHSTRTEHFDWGFCCGNQRGTCQRVDMQWLNEFVNMRIKILAVELFIFHEIWEWISD